MINVKKVLVISLFFFLGITNCFAFDHNYGYNYEITSVDFNGRTGTLEGWAILNAGVNDGSYGEEHGSPKVDRNLESNTKKSYQYTLRIYGINVDSYGNHKEVKYIYGTSKKVSSKLSLYGVMCYTSKGSCVDYRSARYDNVNYKFVFNFNDFNDSSKTYNSTYPNLPINSYKFVLTIKSTNGSCSGKNSAYCTETFPLSFLESAISDNAKKYFDSNTYLNKIYFIANNANVRTGVCSTGSKVTKIYNAGNTYELLETSRCSTNKLTYYKIKIGKKKGWVPSSWIAPLKDVYTLLQNNVCDVDGNKMVFPGVENETTTNSCEALVKLTDEAKGSCVTQNNTEYYKITCKDNIEAEFTPSKTKYYRGDDFDIEAKITSSVTCIGEFNSQLWSDHYARGDSLTKENLIEIRENFKKFAMDDYESNPTGNISYEVNNVSKKREKKNLVISSSKNINTETMDIQYTSASKFVPKSFVYKTNEVEVIMKLSSPIKVNSDKTNTPYKVTISNLGYSNKSKVNFDCEIEKILAIYRPINLENPFISSDRIIGENWKNHKYDFTGIINENLWNDTANVPLYVFFLSRDNIKEITDDNKVLGAGAYLGSDCKYINKEYQCSFIRNKTFFSRIYINGKII